MILHVFCAFTLMTVRIEPADSGLVGFFVIPTIVFLLPILAYSRDDSNIYMLSQYVFVSVFALSESLSPDVTAMWLYLILILVFLVKLRSRASIPPLGPGFLYVAVYAFVIHWMPQFSNGMAIWAGMIALLALKNRIVRTPIVSLALIWWMFDFNTNGFQHELAAAGIGILTVCLCRYRRGAPLNANSYFLAAEELLVALFLTHIVLKATGLAAFQAYAIVGSTYLLAATYVAVRGGPRLRLYLPALVPAAVLGFSMAAHNLDWSLYSPDGWFEDSVLITAACALGSAAAFYLRLPASMLFIKLFVVVNAGNIYLSGRSHIDDRFGPAFFLAANVLTALVFLAVFFRTPFEANRHVARGLYSPRDVVLLRRWIHGARDVIRSLPVISVLVAAAAYVFESIRQSFSDHQRWNVERLLLMTLFTFQMLSFADWTWAVLNVAGLLPVAEDGAARVLRKQEQSVHLAAMSLFGSILAYIGARARLPYILAMGVFLPLGAILVYFLTTQVTTKIPFSLFFVAAALLYIGARYSISGIARERGDVWGSAPPRAPLQRTSAAVDGAEPSGRFALLVLNCLAPYADYRPAQGRGFADPVSRIRRVLEDVRGRSVPVFHVRPADTAGRYRPIDPDILGTAVAPDDGRAREWASGVSPTEGEASVDRIGASAFLATDLERRLRERSVDRLLIAGFETGDSVRATVADAVALGFEVIVLGDCCGDRTDASSEGQLAEISRRYARVGTAEQVFAVIGTRGVPGEVASASAPAAATATAGSG